MHAPPNLLICFVLLCGISGSHGQALPLPLASGGTYFLTEPVSISANSKVIGLARGTALRVLSDNGDTFTVTADGIYGFPLPKNKLARRNDAPTQPAIADAMKVPVEQEQPDTRQRTRQLGEELPPIHMFQEQERAEATRRAEMQRREEEEQEQQRAFREQAEDRAREQQRASQKQAEDRAREQKTSWARMQSEAADLQVQQQLRRQRSQLNEIEARQQSGNQRETTFQRNDIEKLRSDISRTRHDQDWNEMQQRSSDWSRQNGQHSDGARDHQEGWDRMQRETRDSQTRQELKKEQSRLDEIQNQQQSRRP